MTTSRWQKLIFSTLLTGAFLTLPAGVAFAQYEPNERPAGTPADMRQDTRQVNWFQNRAEEQREQWHRDRRQDWRQFNRRHDRDRRQDRRQFNRRHDRDHDGDRDRQ